MKKTHRTRVYMIIASIVLLAVNSTLGFFLTKQSNNAMKTLIDNRMLDISNTAADMLDGDVLGGIRAEDKDTPEYREILKTLTYFQDNIDLKYIYCIRDSGDGHFTFTIDPTTKDPGVFGEPVVYTEALFEASRGTPSVDKKPYKDKWGRFYSSYSPVFDSGGNVAGIVAVDFSADWYDRQISNQIRTIIILTVLSLSFGLIIVFMITSRLRKRILSLHKELNSLSDGIEQLANELSGGQIIAGSEFLHSEPQEDNTKFDDVNLIGERIRSLQKYMKCQIDSVRAEAYKDGLTKLENRSAYLEYVNHINEMIKSGKNHGFAVAMFDINGLKEVNDDRGHDSGDELILVASEMLKSSFEEERIFRIGGDEFVVIMEKTVLDDDNLFEKYRSQFSEPETAVGLNRILSMGFARFDRTKDTCFEDTFARADKLMYENKKTYYKKYGDRRR